MKNIAFLYNNLWDAGALSYSSQHPGFPASNTQQRLHTIPWRTRYGTGLAGGNFVIDATNKQIDFSEGAGELTATLVEGTYSATGLAAQIKTQLDAAGALTYAVTYSTTTRKFTIAAGSNFSLLWNTGSHTAASAAGAIGFSAVADDSGASTYTADYVRIHTEEWAVCDLGSAQSVQAFAVKGHNLSGTAVIRIQANSADSWASPAVDVAVPLASDLVVYHWASPISYRYFRYKIVDVDNADGYAETGRIFLGPFFAPTVNFSDDYRERYIDPSVVVQSSGGQISSTQFTRYREMDFSFSYESYADAVAFAAMFASRGQALDFFVTRDRDIAGTTSYVRMRSPLEVVHVFMETYYNVEIALEELR